MARFEGCFSVQKSDEFSVKNVKSGVFGVFGHGFWVHVCCRLGVKSVPDLGQFWLVFGVF